MEGQWKGVGVSEAEANDAHNVAEAKKTETYGATAEETSKKSVATRSTGSEMQSDSNAQQHEKVVANPDNTPDSAEAQNTTNEQSGVAEMTNIEASKINHEVFNVAKSETSKSLERTNEEYSSKIEATRNTVRRRRNSEGCVANSSIRRRPRRRPVIT